LITGAGAVSDIFGIRKYIERAISFIDGHDDHQLVYAALELRFCMEAIAYRQLSLYKETIPADLVRQWRSNVIVKTLAQFDDASDQTSEISIAVNLPKEVQEALESGQTEGVKDLNYLLVGNAYRIPWKKFDKFYNTLGSYLHVERGETLKYPARSKLRDIAAALEEVASSTVIPAATFATTAQCTCNSLLVLGPRERRGEEVVRCPNRKCNAIYQVDPLNPTTMTRVEFVWLKCPCGADVTFYPDHMLSKEKCPSCGCILLASFLTRAVVVAGPESDATM